MARQKKESKAGRVSLPPGFEPMAREFGDKWDMEKEPVLTGMCTRVKSLPKGGKIKKDTRIMDVKTSDGRVVGVWESAAIRAVFDAASELEGKCEVAFAYQGEKKIPGMKNAMHDIVGAFKPLTRRKK